MAFAIAALVIASLVVPANYQTCDPDQNGHAKQCADHYLGIFVVRLIARFLNAYNGLVTAIATTVIAFFTIALVRANKATADLADKQFALEGRQTDLAERQHGLQRVQFITTHKPTLRLRSVALVAPSEASSSFFQLNEKVKGEVVVANAGGTGARIVSSGYRFFWYSRPLPMAPPLGQNEIKELLPADETLEAHQSVAVPIESIDALESPYEFNTQVIGGTRLYFMGFLEYADIAEGGATERFMGFCRMYKTDIAGSPGRFVPVENADYEYED